jgi:long-chain acyl-CoA synthetase
MIDVDRANHLGEALAEAFSRWPEALCLVESDRERENARLTYAELEERAGAFASLLKRRGYAAGDRAAIAMSNQWKWHAAAIAVFNLGGVLVPLDFQRSAPELLSLLAHCRAKVLIVEHWLWQSMTSAREIADFSAQLVVVTELPGGAAEGESTIPKSTVVTAWSSSEAALPPPCPRSRDDVACIVYSSGTLGRPKGCMLTHGNYLEQFRTLTKLHPFHSGVRYLSILPTNHAIDFMVGFLGPYLCGASVVHLRTLRPDLVREALVRHRITHMALVPMILKNLEAGLRARIAALPKARRLLLEMAVSVGAILARGRPDPKWGRRLLRPVHDAFGGHLEMLFVGGAPTEPETLRFFHRLQIPVANGYGLTEAGTALTLDRLDPPHPSTVGEPLPGVELEIVDPDSEGVGEVAARGPTVMTGYLDDPELTRQTIVNGRLLTGDLGRIEGGCLKLFGRKKNMIVTEGGKNIYPEEVEGIFEGIVAKELCVFAEHFLWPGWRTSQRGEALVLVVHRSDTAPSEEELLAEISRRNKRLPSFRRISRALLWDQDFPRTASKKIRRDELARQIRAASADVSSASDRSQVRLLEVS